MVQDAKSVIALVARLGGGEFGGDVARQKQGLCAVIGDEMFCGLGCRITLQYPTPTGRKTIIDDLRIVLHDDLTAGAAEAGVGGLNFTL
jgi:hypothetical protein